jgi:hypothetical protein
MRTGIVATLLLIAAVGLGGCTEVREGIVSVTQWTGQRIDSLSYAKLNDDPIILDVAGPIGIDVESFGGKVLIDAYPGRKFVTVTVTRYARHGWYREEEADASLDEIEYTVELVPGELGPVLQVRSSTTHPEPYFQSVTIDIKAPEVDGVRVRTDDGDVYARDITGEVDIMTADGDVRVMTNRPMRRPVTIINHAGSIDYRVRAESEGRFDVESVRGLVVKNITHGRVRVDAGTDHNTFLGTLNDGTNPITLRAADGDIRIAVVPAPTQVGIHIVD